MHSDELWSRIADAGWTLGQVRILTQFGFMWILDCERGGERLVAEARTLTTGLEMLAAKIAVLACPIDAIADCRSPAPHLCAFHHEGSCVAEPEDGWEMVLGEPVRCRYRLECHREEPSTLGSGENGLL